MFALQNDDNNELVTNHCEIMNNINNSSLEDDDEPPPLPPPRGASLTRSSVISDVTPSPNTENGKIPVSFSKKIYYRHKKIKT